MPAFPYPRFSYFLAAGIAFVVTLAVTPLVKKLALSLKVVDKPGTRKIHTRAVPGMGGLGIIAGFLASVALFYLINPAWFAALISADYLDILAGGLAMMALGLVDDKRGLDAKAKFTVQFLVAIAVVAGGLRIDKITNPFGTQPFDIGWVSYPLTVLWIVGVTNAINLTDGLDGLASGIGLIVTITMFAVALVIKNPAIALLSAALSGALIAFLRYNFNPAQIFMGDTGSLFLGFMLACFSIKGSLLSSTTVSILTPFIALGLPIFDTLFAFARRLATGKNPFSADREHVHHRLLYFGLTQKQTVGVLYSISIVFGVIAFFLTAANNEMAAALLFVFGILVYIGIQRLGYIESLLLKIDQNREDRKQRQYHGIAQGEVPARTFRTRFLSRRVFFEVTLDLAFVLGAVLFAKIILYGPEFVALQREAGRLWPQLAIVFLSCFASFVYFGFYRDMWRYIDLNAIGKYVKGVTTGMLVSYFILAFFNRELVLRPQTFVIFWLMLLFFTVSSRVVYNFYANYKKRQLTQASGGEKVLIYGAGDRGEAALHTIIRENLRSVNFRPVGFIDDDPLKINRFIQGYKVLGNINDLERIVREREVHRVIVSSKFINGHREGVLKEVCRRNGLTLCNYQVRFNALPL